MEDGVLDFSMETTGGGTLAVMVDGHDLIHIDDSPGPDGMARIVVFNSTHPDATVLWEGVVQIRERSDKCHECGAPGFDEEEGCDRCNRDLEWRERNR